MTTLYSSIIKLRALYAGQLSRDTGQWANGAFYGILNQVDPGLAEALHQWNGRKPFTISSINGLPNSRGHDIYVDAGRECWMRVTTLGEKVFQPFIQRFLQGTDRPKIQIGPMIWVVTEVLTTPGSHPWAGFYNADTLFSHPQPLERLELEFASPTAFNLGRENGQSARYGLFPLPGLVFGSLAAKWQIVGVSALDVAYVEDCAQEICISEFRVQTHTIQWKGRVQKGFRGRCAYDLRRLPAEERIMLTALSDFAFYAGVGGKTTQGMGQCRRIHP